MDTSGNTAPNAATPHARVEGVTRPAGHAVPVGGGQSLVCVKCQYSLAGISHEGVCPECGLPVAESLRSRLASAPLAYLNRLRFGLSMMIVAFVMTLLAQVSKAYFAVSMFGSGGYERNSMETLRVVGAAGLGLSLMSCVILLLGVYLTFSTMPATVRGRLSEPARLWMLWCGGVWGATTTYSILPSLLLAMGAIRENSIEFTGPFTMELMVAASIVATLVLFPFIGGLCVSLVGLSRQSGDAAAETRTRWHLWGAAGTLFPTLAVTANLIGMSGMSMMRLGSGQQLMMWMMLVSATLIAVSMVFAIAATRTVRRSSFGERV